MRGMTVKSHVSKILKEVFIMTEAVPYPVGGIDSQSDHVTPVIGRYQVLKQNDSKSHQTS